MARDKIRWYNEKREIVETIIGKNGKERAITVRDARELDLFPSVTSILAQVNKPALNNYFISRALSVAYNNRELLDNSEKGACYTIMKQADDTGNEAAEFGTLIHDHIERFLKAKDGEGIEIDGEVEEYVNPVFEHLVKNNIKGEAEEAVIIEIDGLKAAGTIDLQTEDTIIDFKTTKTKDGKFTKRDSWIMQLGGYNLFAKKPKAEILAISSTEPGVIKIFSYTDKELEEGTRMFKLLLEFFYLNKGLNW